MSNNHIWAKVLQGQRDFRRGAKKYTDNLQKLDHDDLDYNYGYDNTKLIASDAVEKNLAKFSREHEMLVGAKNNTNEEDAFLFNEHAE